jgi:hypothetical protein
MEEAKMTAQPVLSILMFLSDVPDLSVKTDSVFWGLKPGEWITIAAIIAGPICAVITQIVWQRWKENRTQRIWVFSTLMSLRAQPVSPDYVKALNNIDVVFYKNEKVRARWKTLLEHFSSGAYKKEPVEQATFDKARDLAAELVAEIAKDLGYEFDHTHIKDNAYYPKLFGDLQTKSLQLVDKGAQVLEGKQSIKVKLEE